MSDTINLPQTIPYSSGHKLLIQLITDAGNFYNFIQVDNVPEININLLQYLPDRFPNQ